MVNERTRDVPLFCSGSVKETSRVRRHLKIKTSQVGYFRALVNKTS